MVFLRLLLIATSLASIAVVALRGQWQGRLAKGNESWIVDLGRSPIWEPPPEPIYAEFAKEFKGSDNFPLPNDNGISIRRRLKYDWMAGDLLIYLWVTTVVCGVLYLATRKNRRDIVLHCVVCVASCLTAAVVLFIASWGNGAEILGSTALAIGIVVGLATYKRERSHP